MAKAITLRERILEIQQNRCIYCGRGFSESRATNHHRNHNQHMRAHNNRYSANIKGVQYLYEAYG